MLCRVEFSGDKFLELAKASVAGDGPHRGQGRPRRVPPQARVDSALVEIVRRAEPATSADPDRLVELVETGFNQRRKMLRRSLAGLVSPGGLRRAGVSPEERPERLAVEDWDGLTEAVVALGPPSAVERPSYDQPMTAQTVLAAGEAHRLACGSWASGPTATT